MLDTPAFAPQAVRVGIFYDGGWFSHLRNFIQQWSPWQATLTFSGIHDLVRWHLYLRRQVPFNTISVQQRHYVLGRPPTGGTRGTAGFAFDRTLAREGVIRHDARMSEKGELDADEVLTRVVRETVSVHGLTVVALITGDGDFQPLINDLQGQGVHVIVPAIHQRVIRRDGKPSLLTTHALSADDTTSWSDLITQGLHRDYQLRYPFLGPLKGTSNKGTAGRSSDGYRYGVVTHWPEGETYGLVTASSNGVVWFLGQHLLPRSHAHIAEGQTVRFTGNASTARGGKRPSIYNVVPYDLDVPLLTSWRDLSVTAHR